MTDSRNATPRQPQSSTPVGGRQTSPSNTPDNASAHQAIFVSMVLSMSWQLALVVIVPIVGGHLMDERFKTTPWITLGGLVVAAIGVFAVLTRVVAVANEKVGANKPTEDKK